MVAVTKGFPPDAVREAMEAGLVDVGENYASELVAKAEAMDPAVRRPRWHYLGAVQRNKVARLAPHVGLWQAVARPAEVAAIARAAPGAAVLVQVDALGHDGGRNGVAPEGTGALVETARAAGLDVAGLMVIGPPGPPETSREPFRRVRELAGDLGLTELSMGMSDDLEVAVEEGATMVRLGRALFGARAG